MKAEGNEDYSIQLVQPNLPMQKGAAYKLSFDAYADADRSMKVGISAPDRDYIRYYFNLGAAGSTADVWIGNVSLIKTAEPAGVPDEDVPSNNVDVMQLSWFRDGMTRVNMGFTDAYTNENGNQVISASGMLRMDADDVYVLSAGLSLDTVSIYVNSFVEMDGEESFLVNQKDQTILASRDTSLISKKINELDSSDILVKQANSLIVNKLKSGRSKLL